jgi:hypothetical protein
MLDPSWLIDAANRHRVETAACGPMAALFKTSGGADVLV